MLLQLTDYVHKLKNFCEPSNFFANTTTLYAHFVNITYIAAVCLFYTS